MKALILVGGYGTRLRPLTFNVPKPCVPFVNTPMLVHQMEALRDAGVTDVVLAIAFNADTLKAKLQPYVDKLGITVHYSLEDTPLGTAGPLKLAEKILKDGAFFVLNADITAQFNFKDMIKQHEANKAKGGHGIIAVTKVQDPSKYGVIVPNEDNQIQRFVEKPQTFVSDLINAGIYILEPSVLDRIEYGKPTSIERVVFPAMAAANQLYCKELPGYWMDIGQPKDFLAAIPLYRKTHGGERFIAESAVVEEGADIGENVTIGPNCKVAAGAKLVDCALFDGVEVQKGCFVKSSIIGWSSKLCGYSHVVNSVLGEDVTVKEAVVVSGVKCCPNKALAESVADQIVL